MLDFYFLKKVFLTKLNLKIHKFTRTQYKRYSNYANVSSFHPKMLQNVTRIHTELVESTERVESFCLVFEFAQQIKIKEYTATVDIEITAAKTIKFLF